MNKITKNILRIWISISSLILFAVGWITLAHAQKPAPLTVQMISSASPTESLDLVPVPSLEDLSQGFNRSTIPQPSVNINMPRLRARGS